jgi:hypothetical protein
MTNQNILTKIEIYKNYVNNPKYKPQFKYNTLKQYKNMVRNFRNVRFYHKPKDI